MERSTRPSFSSLTFSSRQARHSSPTLSPLSQTTFINLQFLQELSGQKSYSDQARLSSLVNKQVWGGYANNVATLLSFDIGATIHTRLEIQ